MRELKSHPKKLLKDHLSNVASNCKKEILSNDLNLKTITKENLADISYIIAISHDFGKCTASFQKYIKGNSEKSDSHSPVSSIFGFWLANKYVTDNNINPLFSPISALVIKRHHGNLENIGHAKDLNNKELMIDQIKEIFQDENAVNLYNKLWNRTDIEQVFNSEFSYKKYVQQWRKLRVKLCELEGSDEAVELFLISELLYSVLIDFDKKDAAGILDKKKKKSDIILSESIVENFLIKMRRKNPQKFGPQKPLNKLKNEFLDTVSKSSHISPENHIYSITAPTGIGKTLASLSAAVSLQNKINKPYKIVYVLPYTSIIDQNYDEFKNVLAEEYDAKFKEKEGDFILKQHYLADINLNKGDYSELNYNQQLLLMNSWDSTIVVSTYVQFLMSIIGFKSSFLNKFHNIVNSIILLDEVQFIDVKDWKLIRRVCSILSERFNVYFFLMTATQPKIFKGDQIVELSKSEFFEHKLINEKLESKYLKEKVTVSEFSSFFVDNIYTNENRILIIVNTKKSAIKIYNQFSEMNKFKDFEKIHLSTLLTPKDRKEKIEYIKELQEENKKYIIVTTQLIEAGVDITSDLCVRDLAPCDSIIQSAGRCNRYNEIDKGKYYILNSIVDDSERSLYNFVYQDKFSLTKTRGVLDKGFSNFHRLMQDFFSQIEGSSRNVNAEKDVETLRFGNLKDDFKIIDKDIESENIIIIQDLESEKIFQEYFEVLENEENDSFEKFSQLKNLKRKLQKYSVEVYKRDFDKIKEYVQGEKMKHIPKRLVENIYSYEEGLKIYDETGIFIE